MNFLFISSIFGPTIGGTEALISRMSKWLCGHGHQVTLFVNSVGDYREIFPPELRIIVAGDELFEYCYWHKSKIFLRRLQITKPDVIKSFDLVASWISSVLASRMNPAPKVVFGSYNPNIFPRSRNPIRQHTRRLLLHNLMLSFRDESILCMSMEQIADFQHHYGTHRKIRFWPLPVDKPAHGGPPRKPQWGQLVSIGRLDPMKSYNLHMIDIVGRLRAEHHPVSWIVYGDGELSDAMKSRIDELRLNDAIQLMGQIAYPKIAEALREAFVFVGMGTAIIEAALCEVPGIVALAYGATDATYGPLYRFTFGNIGESMIEPPTSTVEGEIRRMLKLTELEYQQEVLRTIQYARRYEMEAGMKDFVALVKRAAPPKQRRALFCYYYLDSLVTWVLKETPVGASPDFFSNRKKAK